MATPSQVAPANRMPSYLIGHEIVLAVILLVSLVVLATQTDRFLTTGNLLNQGRLMTEVGLVALPMTFIIITGGIDLSVGSIMGLCAIVLGVVWQNFGLPLELAIVVTLAVGALAGFFNGWFITRIGVPPLIMTLATLALYRGLAEGISQARSVRGYPEWFFRARPGRGSGRADPALDPGGRRSWSSAVVLARTTFGRSPLRDRPQRDWRRATPASRSTASSSRSTRSRA